MNSIAQTYSRIGLTPSPAQLAFAKSIVGEPLTATEQEVMRECTGRTDYPPAPFQEVTGILGRKSGKTEYIASPITIHRCKDGDDPGTHLFLAPSKTDQARLAWEAMNRQLVRGFPGLIADVREAEGRVILHNGHDIKFASSNFRNLRGPKYKTVTVDEACFFVSDQPEDGGANPLPYILDSVAGGMIATAHPLLLILSSPWNRAGVVYEHFRDRDATPDRLVWRAPTLLMNPYANRALMERHRKDRGENFYSREYLGNFSEDSFAYIESADIDAAVSAGNAFFPPQPGVHYCMGLDPGRKRDHFGAAIAHRELDTVIVDWAREWKPGLFGLKYADILPSIWQKARAYGVKKIASDQIDFGGLEASVPRVNGIPEFTMERVMTGGQAGAELSDVSRGLFATRKIVLPDQAGLADEFKRLADYLTQGGVRDIRAKRGADDRSRAVMLAVFQAFSQPRRRTGDPHVNFISLGRSAARSDEGPERIWQKLP